MNEIVRQLVTLTEGDIKPYMTGKPVVRLYTTLASLNWHAGLLRGINFDGLGSVVCCLTIGPSIGFRHDVMVDPGEAGEALIAPGRDSPNLNSYTEDEEVVRLENPCKVSSETHEPEGYDTGVLVIKHNSGTVIISTQLEDVYAVNKFLNAARKTMARSS